MSSTISYHGIVEIKHYNKHRRLVESKVIHNEGTIKLFSFLCKTLADEAFYRDNCPGNILLYDASPFKPLSEVIQRSNQPTYSTEDVPVVTYSFFLPYSRTIRESNDPAVVVANKKLMLLPLYKNVVSKIDSESEAYATITISNNTRRLQEGDYLTILWRLIFTNGAAVGNS